MEYTSSIGFTVGTLTDCHVEVKECSKYQLMFASAKNVSVRKFFR